MSFESFLSNVRIFSVLSSEELGRVSALATEKHYGKGDVILKEGDEGGDEFFIVLKGVVAINKNVAGGRKRNLSNLKEGEVFGELVMFDAEKRSADSEAVTDVSALAIKNKDFLSLMESNCKLGYKVQHEIIKMLAERLRNTGNLLNEGVIWGFKITS